MAYAPTSLEKPIGGIPLPTNEPVIHTIPEKFYMAGIRKKVVKEPPKPAVPPSKPPEPPKPAVPPTTPPTGQPPKKKSGKGLLIAGGIVLFLALAAGGALFFFRDVIFKPPAPVNQPVAVVNNAPPEPVCGDGNCDSSETAESCPTDCKAPEPPTPVCGDEKCDSSETAESCPTDCKPPAPPEPVCGDGKCESSETSATCSQDCQPLPPEFGKDSDHDGLTDAEETTVYGTNPNDPDTDKDTFTELNEAINLFDPAKPRPAMLKDNPGIGVYDSTTEPAFELFYPKAWTVKMADQQNGGVMFEAPTGEFFQVLVIDRTDTGSLMNWYLNQAPGVSSSQVEAFQTKQGYDEVTSPDKMTAYVGVGSKVYVLSYNLGSQSMVNFQATFHMMVNSFMVLGAKP